MDLGRLLRQQGGVVRVDQAVACGVSTRTLRRRVAEEGWQRLHPGVLLASGHRLTGEARVRAAWLWAGDRALVSGPAAAYWHGMLERAPDVVEVTVPRHHNPRPQPGIRVRRRGVAATDHVGLRDIWLTDRALTLLETATVLPDGSAFLDRGLQRFTSFDAVRRAYSRMIGSAASREAGRLLVAAADRADSAAERLLVRLLREAGIAGWVLGHPFGRFRIDLAFPAAQVAVEVDGWAWHVDAERFTTDRRKGNALVRAGWDLLRFTWHDLANDPARVVAEIRQTLAQAA
ncbi:MAG: DUF559 domain-containing protein [Pseudonocardia sp.]|nr:DUF559 domain-containing protein [Pseudonocardia sp.]